MNRFITASLAAAALSLFAAGAASADHHGNKAAAPAHRHAAGNGYVSGCELGNRSFHSLRNCSPHTYHQQGMHGFRKPRRHAAAAKK